MSKLQFAVIGFGNMGKIHYKAITKNNLCAKPFIVENNPEMLSGYENIEFYDDFEYFISKKGEEIDGVIISTPSIYHFEHAKPFIEKKIPVLIEKPITSNYSTDNEIFEAARKNKTLIKCGLIELYNPIVEELSNLDFQEIKFVHFKRHSPKTLESRKLENIILDLTLHDISIIYKVFEPEQIEIIGCDLTFKKEIAESAQILLKINNSFTIFLSSSRQDQEKIRTVEIFDENMSYFCDLKNKFYETKQSGKISTQSSKSITESNIQNKIDMLHKPETAELQMQSFINAIIEKDLDLKNLEIAEKTHQLAYKLLNT